MVSSKSSLEIDSMTKKFEPPSLDGVVSPKKKLPAKEIEVVPVLPEEKPSLMKEGELYLHIFVDGKDTRKNIKDITPVEMVEWVKKHCPSLDVTVKEVDTTQKRNSTFELAMRTLSGLKLTVPMTLSK